MNKSNVSDSLTFARSLWRDLDGRVRRATESFIAGR
jgi:hypothetical protein